MTVTRNMSQMGIDPNFIPDEPTNRGRWKRDYEFLSQVKTNPKHVLVGDYNYAYLCKPEWPWCRGGELREAPQFFAYNQPLGIFTALVMGLQHSLAMVGGIITPPLVVSYAANDPQISSFLISTALIVSGICTIFQVMGLRIIGTNLQYGTGIISVIGVSFTFLTVAQSSIATMMSQGNTFGEAYGRLMGTSMVACWVVVALSFVPHRALRRIFPPMISGVTIFLVGAALIGVGFEYWGGGVFCASNTHGLEPVPIVGCQVPNATTGALQDGTCYNAAIVPKCNGSGDVLLPYGSWQYVLLGGSVFMFLVLIEIFGSPFMRNAEVIIALLLGYIIAACLEQDGKRYVTMNKVNAAKSITFLWTTTFPYGFYAPALLPFCIGYLVTAVEAIGDITASEEASMLATVGDDHERRIKGGLFGDGVNCFFGALAYNLPATTFAQNNGVIALTRCASRYAGVACGTWLIIFGVLAKIGAFFLSIPDSVLGGMTTFLFANVCVSGIKVMVMEGMPRRNRFILGVAIGLGLGVTIVPEWATNNLWPITETMSSGVRGFRDAIILVLSSGFSMGCLSAIGLHLILPMEQDDSDGAVAHEGSAGSNDRSMKDEIADKESYKAAGLDTPPKHASMDKGESAV